MSTIAETAFDPKSSDSRPSREMLEQFDDAPTSREHWKILFISGTGFLTDAYDLFVSAWSLPLLRRNGISPTIKNHCSLPWRCSRLRGVQLSLGAWPITSDERRSMASRCLYWRLAQLPRPSRPASGG
jgi:hypothetical protein